MKGSKIFVPKELLDVLQKTIVLEASDLKLMEFDRGFKAGQLELLGKITQLYKTYNSTKETSNG